MSVRNILQLSLNASESPTFFHSTVTAASIVSFHRVICVYVDCTRVTRQAINYYSAELYSVYTARRRFEGGIIMLSRKYCLPRLFVLCFDDFFRSAIVCCIMMT